MSKDQLRQALQTKPKPRFNINLQDFAPITSNPTSFDFSFNIQDPSTISSSPELPCIAEFQQFYIQNLSSIKENAKRFVLKNKAEEILGEKRQEKATRKWLKKIEKIESYNRGHTWIWSNAEGCQFVTEEFADDSDVKLYINPRFLTDPERFNKNFTPVTKFASYKFTDNFHKVSDPVSEHLKYRSDQVWSIAEIKAFLIEFFKNPKKFEDIKKTMPEKTTKDLVQLFYMMKYQFKLKKMLRIQARRRRDDVVTDHVTQIIQKIWKMFPGKEWISQDEFSNRFTHHKEMTTEEYQDKYGKDTSRNNTSSRDFLDYSRYKEYAFGGHRIYDEGPILGEDLERKGAQWSYEEKMDFIRHFKQLGRNWDEIAAKLGGKTSSQVRNFFQNYKKKLKLEDVNDIQDEKEILAAAGIIDKTTKPS